MKNADFLSRGAYNRTLLTFIGGAMDSYTYIQYGALPLLKLAISFYRSSKHLTENG